MQDWSACSIRRAQQGKEGAQGPLLGKPALAFMGMVLPPLHTHLTHAILCCPFCSIFQIFLFSPRQFTTRQEEKASRSAREDSGWTSGKIFYREGCQALKQAAQRRVGVTIPGGVEETTGHGTECCGLVDKVVTGQRLKSQNHRIS